ncbi:exodeoxyribonuclease III [Mariprofundus micogutta]|uniref:Exodeoxyribonuclease III n=1 Tax=Mariprofundus micogutta TaxID=1921010 RepID=A0A1L8CMW0_9PROT|nr:exodeoxyribonuclease III [Mariprofundus micogutta]GAV20250.1 exodeoxyribonuclease III [Mariprofundus micogutta]
MKIVTWNVNSLNVRLAHVLLFLEKHRPDVLCLQETKLPDEKFPAEEIQNAGYQAVYSGQKTYNGVAIISRKAASDLIMDVPDLDDPQRRLLAATIEGVRIINVYIPNGQEVGSDKYAYKFRWLASFADFLKDEMDKHERLVLLGDYNIAPADIDVHDPARWSGKITCSPPERQVFADFLGLGLVDTVRSLHTDTPLFSWWDYRMNAFRRSWGLRIDHQLATANMKAMEAGVDTEYRAMERPSDHAPVWVEFE